MLDSLKDFSKDLRALRKLVLAENKTFIGKSTIQNEAERLGALWFSDHAPVLAELLSDQGEVISDYDAKFSSLLKLGSAATSRATTYTKVLDGVTKRFNEDFILPIQKLPKAKAIETPLDEMLAAIDDPSESVYLREARDCARYEFYRAAAVLGWCAAIDRVHRKIQDIGFDVFNTTSESLANRTKGRFKNFKKKQNVESLSELRKMVPDDVVLWIIEGMELIEANERDRLAGCFAIRNQSAHPGDAPITQWNLLHFFSDLKELVFENEAFAVSLPAAEAE
jgi:hypothetical protein